MKKIFFPAMIILAVFTGLSAFKFHLNALPIGSDLPKPEAKVQDINGKEISLKSARKENGLLVMFSCNTCPYVIKNQERTNAICKFAMEQGYGVILLNSNELLRENEDSYQAMKSYAKDQAYQWYYAVDKNSELADAFEANRTPECFLFNKDLKLAYHGGIDDNPGDEASVTRIHLKEAILELAEGKEVSVKESRSVGCTIKRKK